MNSIQDIDRLFAHEQDAQAASRNYIDAARKILEDEFELDSRGETRKSRRYPLFTAAAVVAVAACAALFLLMPRALSVTVEGENRELSSGSWVSSPKDDTLQLSFSDGSSIKLKESTELRVQSLREQGAHLLLERGHMGVSVVHRVRGRTEWKIDAGPYQIHVTGTKFNVNWVPEHKALMLEMVEGSVELTGPMMDKGKSLVKGDVLRSALGESVVELSRKEANKKIITRLDEQAGELEIETEALTVPIEEDVANESSSEESIQPEESVQPVEIDSSSSSRPARHRFRHARKQRADSEQLEIADGANDDDATPFKRAQPERGLSWRTLAKDGKYHAAVTLAEDAGFERIVSSASSSDLMLLGDAARFTHNIARAEFAYQTVRSRFPATKDAQRAAFAMGRIAFESHGSYAAAARWFAVCYKENSKGALAREAAGRRMEALNRAGKRVEAQAAAKIYLDRYTKGPHSELAEKILLKSATK